MEDRVKGLDSIGGLFILYMVAMHIAQRTNTELYLGVGLYIFMPWFFFKSGMFYKKQSIVANIQKDTKKLLMPFFSFSCIGLTVSIILGDVKLSFSTLSSIISSMIKFGSISGNMPLWFLLSLFVVKNVFNLSVEFINIKVAPLLLLILFFSIGVLLYLYKVKYPLYLGNISMGMVFYILGYFMKNIRNIVIISILSLIYLYSIVYPLGDSNMRENYVEGGVMIYILYYLYCLSGIIFFNWAFTFFKIQIRVIDKIGASSMVYFVLHWPLLCVFLFILNKTNMDDNLKWLITFVTVILVTHFVNKVFKNNKIFQSML